MKNIRALEEDKDFKRLVEQYESPNCFSIMGKIRREEWHSNFISWLLNPRGNHKLGEFPLQNFWNLLNSKMDETKRFKVYKEDIEKMEFQNEVKIPEGRPDIIGKSDKLILIIENKIDACETVNKTNGKYQTDIYYEYFNKNKKNNQRICFVYLTPSLYNRPHNKNFISITYQELYDSVINPCINSDNIKIDTKCVLKQYAIDISNPKLGRTHMAYTEKQMAESIYNRHEEVFELLRTYMNDINRVKKSDVCIFYERYREYINAILGTLGKVIIMPRTEDNPKGKDLIKNLCDANIIVPNETELITSRHKATYIIRVCIIDGKYQCYAGYLKGIEESEYTGKEQVTLLMDGDAVIYYDTIGAAATAIETEHMKQMGEEVSSNPGPSAGQWKILRAGKTDAERKQIKELYHT